uniref:Uncharacterized protein n=1 Tax=Panagrolaimus davidi TaxID=227884 RepID=A0A914QC48_9BILA
MFVSCQLYVFINLNNNFTSFDWKTASNLKNKAELFFEPGVASNVLRDPQNEAIKKFMEQNKEYVNKIWDEQEQQLRESTGILNIEEDLLAPHDVTSDQIESFHE